MPDAPCSLRRIALEAFMADRLEVAGVGGDQERQAIELDGLAHPRHQPIGEAVEVEIAVQLARKADQSRR